MTALLGTVLERDGAVYRVALPAGGTLRAVLRGKAKRAAPRVVVGDLVRLEPEPRGELYGIVGVEPRRSLLARRAPESRTPRPVAANVDEVFVVTAAADPAPLPQLLDRLLVLAEANGLPAAVAVNKVDLEPGEALARRFGAAGYPVFRTSVRTGEGLEELRRALAGRTSVVTGPSGVGKSSLLNAIQPGLRLRTAELSARARRGRHTTVSAVMVPLEQGGYLMDTPGFGEVGLWGIEPRELAACFPELRPYAGRCRYADCRHAAEPGCAVHAAVAEGAIPADRYDSYLRLLAEIEGTPAPWE